MGNQNNLFMAIFINIIFIASYSQDSFFLWVSLSDNVFQGSSRLRVSQGLSDLVLYIYIP